MADRTERVHLGPDRRSERLDGRGGADRVVGRIGDVDRDAGEAGHVVGGVARVRGASARVGRRDLRLEGAPVVVVDVLNVDGGHRERNRCYERGVRLGPIEDRDPTVRDPEQQHLVGLEAEARLAERPRRVHARVGGGVAPLVVHAEVEGADRHPAILHVGAVLAVDGRDRPAEAGRVHAAPRRAVALPHIRQAEVVTLVGNVLALPGQKDRHGLDLVSPDEGRVGRGRPHMKGAGRRKTACLQRQRPGPGREAPPHDHGAVETGVDNSRES